MSCKVLLLDDTESKPPEALVWLQLVRDVRAWLLANEGGVLVGPAAIKAELASPLRARVFGWDEIKNLSTAQNESFDDLFLFHEAVTKVMCRNRDERFSFVFRSLNYSFMAPYSEEFPLFVSGFRWFVNARPVSEIVLWGGRASGMAALAADVGCAMGVFVTRDPHVSVVGRAVLQDAARLWKLFGRSVLALFNQNVRAVLGLFAHRCQADVWAVASKERAMRAIGPVSDEAAALGHMVRVFPSLSGPGALPAWRPSRVIFWLRAMRAYWVFFFQVLSSFLICYRRLVRLPNRYHGALIARYQVPYILDILATRAAAAAYSEALFRQEIEEFPPSAVFSMDPLEASVLAVALARKAKVPTLTYYGLYNGWNSTATLWERNLVPASCVLTLNQWMATRASESNLSLGAPAIPVGDILRAAYPPTEASKVRNEISRNSGLDPKVPWMLVLSRAPGSALSEEGRSLLLLEAARAAQSIGAELIVKGHPFENLSNLKNEVRAVSSRARVWISEYPLDRLISSASIVVTTPSSSTALDAFYAQVPVIIFGPKKLFDYLDQFDGPLAYQRHSAGELVFDDATIVGAAKALMENPMIRESAIRRGNAFVERVIGGVGANASQAIASHLHRLIVTAS